MPDELKVGDRLYVRGYVTTEAITSITATHMPVGGTYVPVLVVTITGDNTPLVVDPRTAIEVAL